LARPGFRGLLEALRQMSVLVWDKS